MNSNNFSNFSGENWKYSNPIHEIIDDIFINNVKYLELITESGLQFPLTGWVLREYGIEDDIQLISLAISSISMIKCNVDRIAFIRHKRDVGLASREFMATWLEIFIPMQLTFVIGNVASWSDETTPPWFLFYVVLHRYQLPALLYFLTSTFVVKFKRINAFMKIMFAIPFMHFFIYLNLNGTSSLYWMILVSF